MEHQVKRGQKTMRLSEAQVQSFEDLFKRERPPSFDYAVSWLMDLAKADYEECSEALYELASRQALRDGIKRTVAYK